MATWWSSGSIASRWFPDVMATVVVQQARQTDAPRFLSLSRNELLRRKLEAATLANRGTAPTSTDWERSAAASGDLSDDHRSRELRRELGVPAGPARRADLSGVSASFSDPGVVGHGIDHRPPVLGAVRTAVQVSCKEARGLGIRGAVVDASGEVGQIVATAETVGLGLGVIETDQGRIVDQGAAAVPRVQEEGAVLLKQEPSAGLVIDIVHRSTQ